MPNSSTVIFPLLSHASKPESIVASGHRVISGIYHILGRLLSVIPQSSQWAGALTRLDQCSQNVDVSGPHRRCFELIVSSSFNQPMAVERGRSHELVGSMVGAVYVDVLRTMAWTLQIPPPPQTPLPGPVIPRGGY